MSFGHDCLGTRPSGRGASRREVFGDIPGELGHDFIRPFPNDGLTELPQFAQEPGFGLNGQLGLRLFVFD